ncbi:hypothetical protein U1Q18_022133, partial [Sarracenia purpurea var. burkii]
FLALEHVAAAAAEFGFLFCCFFAGLGIVLLLFWPYFLMVFLLDWVSFCCCSVAPLSWSIRFWFSFCWVAVWPAVWWLGGAVVNFAPSFAAFLLLLLGLFAHELVRLDCCCFWVCFLPLRLIVVEATDLLADRRDLLYLPLLVFCLVPFIFWFFW